MKILMKKIVIVCPHPKDVAPGQRLKYEQYIESWEKNGFVRCSWSIHSDM